MASLNCYNCGGALEVLSDRFYKCRYCDTLFENKNIADEENILLISANALLRKGAFEDAYNSFGEIIERFPHSYNAYFGRLLAKHGIIYVDDLLEGKKVPTCNNVNIEPIISDTLLLKAIELAPEAIGENYRAKAEVIEKIRKEWLVRARNEQPYDVFICYKESDKSNGIQRTPDSYEAQMIYTHLTMKGYKVFFSRETLRDKVAENYEPYIFNALNTAKAMIVYGQNPEYFESVWVKNEWGRWAKKISQGLKPDNSLIVAYEKMNPYELPQVLNKRQCLNAAEKSFFHDLECHLSKVLAPEKNSKAKSKRTPPKISKSNTIKLHNPYLLFAGLILLLQLFVPFNTLDKGYSQAHINSFLYALAFKKHGAFLYGWGVAFAGLGAWGILLLSIFLFGRAFGSRISKRGFAKINTLLFALHIFILIGAIYSVNTWSNSTFRSFTFSWIPLLLFIALFIVVKTRLQKK